MHRLGDADGDERSEDVREERREFVGRPEESADELSEVITDLNSSSIAEIAEALWVYSKYASVLSEADNNSYLKSKLFNIRDEIEAKLDIIEDKTKRDEMREICSNVFTGEIFGDEAFNTILERIIVQ